MNKKDFTICRESKPYTYDLATLPIKKDFDRSLGEIKVNSLSSNKLLKVKRAYTSNNKALVFGPIIFHNIYIAQNIASSFLFLLLKAKAHYSLYVFFIFLFIFIIFL